MEENTQLEAILKNALQGDALSYFAYKIAEKEQQDKFDDHGRASMYKKHLHRIVVLITYVIGGLITIAIILRSFHLLAPKYCHWLNEEELHSIDMVLFSSIIFSLGSRYFEYYKLFQKEK